MKTSHKKNVLLLPYPQGLNNAGYLPTATYSKPHGLNSSALPTIILEGTLRAVKQYGC